MAHDPKTKRDKTPDLSLVGPTAAARKPVTPADQKTDQKPPGPPPLPPSAAKSGSSEPAGARPKGNELIPLPAAPSAQAQAKGGSVTASKAAGTAKPAQEEPGKAKSPAPPPLPDRKPPPDSSKIVRPLKLSELQRRPEIVRPKANGGSAGPQADQPQERTPNGQ